jgi:hypothetical protein
MQIKRSRDPDAIGVGRGVEYPAWVDVRGGVKIPARVSVDGGVEYPMWVDIARGVEMPVRVGHRRRSQVPGVVRCHRRSRVPGTTQWWSHDPDTARQGRGGEILAEHSEDQRRRVRVCESRDACTVVARSSARVWRGHIVAWPYILTGARRRGIVGLGYVGRGHHLMGCMVYAPPCHTGRTSGLDGPLISGCIMPGPTEPGPKPRHSLEQASCRWPNLLQASPLHVTQMARYTYRKQ